MLPLTVLRRFDCVLAPVKQDMLDTYDKVKGRDLAFGDGWPGSAHRPSAQSVGRAVGQATTVTGTPLSAMLPLSSSRN